MAGGRNDKKKSGPKEGESSYQQALATPEGSYLLMEGRKQPTLFPWMVATLMNFFSSSNDKVNFNLIFKFDLERIFDFACVHSNYHLRQYRRNRPQSPSSILARPKLTRNAKTSRNRTVLLLPRPSVRSLACCSLKPPYSDVKSDNEIIAVSFSFKRLKFWLSTLKGVQQLIKEPSSALVDETRTQSALILPVRQSNSPTVQSYRSGWYAYAG
jgi:hypothetical protein